MLQPITRRRVLQGLGVLPFLPLLDQEATAAMACPAQTPGSVTGETGSIDGWTPGFEDAFTQHDPPRSVSNYSWQLWTLLSSHAGAADRFPRNESKKGERWLNLILYGSHVGDPTNYDEVPYRIGTYTVNQQVDETYTAPDGSTKLRTYIARVNWTVHDDRCRQTSSGIEAWSGTVTFTRMDDQASEGSFDLTKGDVAVAGSFAGPRVNLDGCPPRPSKITCVT